MSFYKLLLCLLLFVFSRVLYAIEKIEVQALMPGMVVLMVDGERTTIKSSGEPVNGITLISSDTKSAVLEINGQQKTYQMGTSVRTSFTQREEISEQLIIDNYGMFRAHGSINGHSVKFLVDTGASSVAMSARDARKLGIQYRLDGKKTTTSTASGIAKAWIVTLKTVSIGGLKERNVEGVVIDGDFPRHVLLGMTFLNRMKVDKEGNTMIISKKR